MIINSRLVHFFFFFNSLILDLNWTRLCFRKKIFKEIKKNPMITSNTDLPSEINNDFQTRDKKEINDLK